MVGATALAALIGGLSALSPRTSVGPEEPSAAVVESRNLFDKAMDLLQSGETTAALEALKESIAKDPANEQAADELRRLTQASDANGSGGTGSGNGSGNGGGGGTPPNPGSSGEYSKEQTDTSVFLPKTPAGFVAAFLESGPDSAQQPLEPSPDGSYYGLTSRVVMSVYDRGTEAQAKSFVENAKKAYPDSSSSVALNKLSGYYGTDAGRFAAVSFSKGRYAFEVVAAISPGGVAGQSIDLKNMVLKIARTYPATSAS